MLRDLRYYFRTIVRLRLGMHEFAPRGHIESMYDRSVQYKGNIAQLSGFGFTI